eukprot:COSAG01_NODE_28583_length_657_cov_3.129032_1_plen_59_part_00
MGLGLGLAKTGGTIGFFGGAKEDGDNTMRDAMNRQVDIVRHRAKVRRQLKRGLSEEPH